MRKIPESVSQSNYTTGLSVKIPLTYNSQNKFGIIEYVLYICVNKNKKYEKVHSIII
jgi:hypothetical protein